MSGQLVISLDFELHWGLRDLVDPTTAGPRLRGVWEAVPALLDTFRAYGVRATWATVGLLFAESREEALAACPTPLPSYADARLSPWAELRAAGRDEREDPLHFAPSLVDAIAAAPGQELATHTFSHFYCLERGPSVDDFRRDLRAATDLAARRGHTLKSLVFPRNQYGPEHLAVLPELGLTAFRSTTPNRLYKNRPTASETRRRRAARLVDHYLPLAGSDVVCARRVEGVPGLVDVPGSRFLRPWSRRLAPLDGLRLRRITADLRRAGETGGLYHLWWHPHNFGVDLAENLGFLRSVLDEYARVREDTGLTSCTMAEVSA